MTKNEQIKLTLAKTRAKRAKQVCKVFKVKIDSAKLSSQQEEELKMLFIEGKRFYNHEVALVKDGTFKDVNPLSIKDVVHLDKDNTRLTSHLEFLTSAQKQALNKQIQSQLKTMSTLRRRGFQSHSQLHFISELKSLPLKQYKNTHMLKDQHHLKICGVSGVMKVNGCQQFWNMKHIEFANAKLLNKAHGYYLALTCYLPKKDKKISKHLKRLPDIGIDFGCETTMTFSDGTKKTLLVEETERLKREQKKLSRQQRNSNNWKKTQNKIRRQHESMMNKKEDISNKEVATLSKKFCHVIIQDEQLHNWHKNGHGKKVQHSCLGRLKAKIKQRCNAVVLDKFIPTTKLCRECGQKHEMKQSEHTFRCSCGVVQDRDVHAAQNMLWMFQNLVGRDTAELTLEDFRAAVACFQWKHVISLRG